MNGNIGMWLIWALKLRHKSSYVEYGGYIRT